MVSKKRPPRQNLAQRLQSIAKSLDENVVFHVGIRKSGQIDLLGMDIAQLKGETETAKLPVENLSYIG